MNILNFFRKPSITAKLVNGGKQVKVNLVNTTSENVMTMLFLMTKQVAKMMNMEHRQILNGLKDIDTQMHKTIKKAERVAKYGK